MISYVIGKKWRDKGGESGWKGKERGAEVRLGFGNGEKGEGQGNALRSLVKGWKWEGKGGSGVGRGICFSQVRG